MKTPERRARERKRVIFGAQASVPGKATKRDCVVRNISDGGAFIEIDDVKTLPDDIALSIPRKGRAYSARVIWSEEKAAGVAFDEGAPSGQQESALEEQLRVSQRKMRKLKQRVRELTGEA